MNDNAKGRPLEGDRPPADDPAKVSTTVTLTAEESAQVQNGKRLLEQLNAADHAAEPDTLKAQLRRRREASWRMRPMVDYHGERAG